MVNGQTDAKFFTINTVQHTHSVSITHAHHFSYVLNSVAYKWSLKFNSSTHAIQFVSFFILIHKMMICCYCLLNGWSDICVWARFNVHSLICGPIFATIHSVNFTQNNVILKKSTKNMHLFIASFIYRCTLGCTLYID